MPAVGNRTSCFKAGANLTRALTAACILSACQSDQEQAQTPEFPHLRGDGITVFAAGDIADCQTQIPGQTGAAATAALITQRLATDPHAKVLTLGDHTYPIGLAEEFTGCYEPTWGKFKERTFPTPGNHEYYTPQADGYYRYFGGAAGPDRRGYYSFNLGDWHIISLNSNLRQEDHKAQLTWLQADLKRNDARCTLAYWHHPLFSSSIRGDSQRMLGAWTLLQAADADVILTAHDHHYERFSPLNIEGLQDDDRGIRQFIVGTGGAELSTLPFRAMNSEVRNNSTYGVLKLVLKKDGYEWEFLPAGEGRFTDRGAARCH